MVQMACRQRCIAASSAHDCASHDSCWYALQVPPAWLRAYPSLKALGPWTRDLLQRLDQLKRWIDKGYPLCYWLAGFTYPTAFLTAVLQVCCPSPCFACCRAQSSCAAACSAKIGIVICCLSLLPTFCRKHSCN